MPANNLQNITKAKQGTAVRERGQTRVKDILKTAQGILVEEGIANLTLRTVAKKLNISVGNLTYYFPSKESLLQAIIENVIEGYDLEIQREAETFPNDPVGKFKAFLHYVIQDTKHTDAHGFFYQLWGLSTHNQAAADMRHKMYIHFVEQMVSQLRDLELGLSQKKLNNLALSILAVLEGLHVIYGSSPEFLKDYEGFDQEIYERILAMAGLEDSQ